jgi:uncharacterized membrane protein YkvA (DUF1232 family)
LFDLASHLAPADVTSLLKAGPDLQRRADRLHGEGLDGLADRLRLAIDCLRDHVEGVCPQIPYYTISLLAAAVAYFTDELDVIPDFLPKVGKLDDAVVMAMAFELAHDGLRRYCAFKGRDASILLRPMGTGAPA